MKVERENQRMSPGQLEQKTRRALQRIIKDIGTEGQIALLLFARELAQPGDAMDLVLNQAVRPPLKQRLGIA